MKIIISNNQVEYKSVCKSFGYFPKAVHYTDKTPKAVPDRHAIVIQAVPNLQVLQEKLLDENLKNRNWIICCDFEVNKADVNYKEIAILLK